MDEQKHPKDSDLYSLKEKLTSKSLNSSQLTVAIYIIFALTVIVMSFQNCANKSPEFIRNKNTNSTVSTGSNGVCEFYNESSVLSYSDTTSLGNCNELCQKEDYTKTCHFDGQLFNSFTLIPVVPIPVPPPVPPVPPPFPPVPPPVPPVPPPVPPVPPPVPPVPPPVPPVPPVPPPVPPVPPPVERDLCTSTRYGMSPETQLLTHQQCDEHCGTTLALHPDASCKWKGMEYAPMASCKITNYPTSYLIVPTAQKTQGQCRFSCEGISNHNNRRCLWNNSVNVHYARGTCVSMSSSGENERGRWNNVTKAHCNDHCADSIKEGYGGRRCYFKGSLLLESGIAHCSAFDSNGDFIDGGTRLRSKSDCDSCDVNGAVECLHGYQLLERIGIR